MPACNGDQEARGVELVDGVPRNTRVPVRRRGRGSRRGRSRAALAAAHASIPPSHVGGVEPASLQHHRGELTAVATPADHDDRPDASRSAPAPAMIAFSGR